MSERLKRSILTRLYHIGRHLRLQGEPAGGVGDLTLHQMQAVLLVKRRQPARMGELAEGLRISPATASLLADRLVEAGWLRRVPDEQDRRSVRLELSATADRRFEALRQAKLDRASRMLEALDAADLAELDRILGRLQEALADGPDGRAG